MILIILLVIFLIIALVSWIYLLNDCKRLKIVGPFPIPLLGNALMFAGNSTHFFKTAAELCKKYGDVIRVHIVTDRYIILSHPKHIEPLCSSTDFITKGASYNYIKPWLGEGLLTASGQRWRKHRKFLTPAFHFNILQNFMPVFCKNEKILIEKLFSLADGKPFDLFPMIALAALDNVTESIMGVSVNAQQDRYSEYVKAIEDVSEVISSRMRNPFVWNDICFNLVYGKRHNKALDILQGYTNKVIIARREELKRKGITSLPPISEQGIKNKQAFLDLLLLSEIDGEKINDEAVREEVDTFMFEGHDTTTSGITFCLYCISKCKDVEEKILQEQMDIFGDDLARGITYSDLQHMHYLDQTIRESLRLYPSVPFIERYITRDSKLGELSVPKSSAVIINIFQMQRNPDLYEDPLVFRPERFENTAAQKPFSWISFSAGPRNCIGQKFAMMEMKVTISGIIRKFKLVPSGIEPILCADLILRSKNGVHVGFLPRHLDT